MDINNNIFKYLLLGFVLNSCNQTLITTNYTQTNVLFIAVDDLRTNIGAYGDSIAITPNINKLSYSGLTFEKAYCQMAVCGPSRSSVLTGMYPDQIGVTDLNTHFRIKQPNVVTLPQIFKINGYKTLTIGKIFHGRKSAQDSISLTSPSILNLGIKKEQYLLAKNRTGKKAYATEAVDTLDEGYWDGKIARHAVNALKKFKNSGEPFFLGVGFMKPHLPFSAPKKYWDKYIKKNVFGLINRSRPIGAPSIAFHNSNELRGYTDIGDGIISLEKEKELWHGYYASTTYTDFQIGKVINALDSLNMRDNTLIIFWSDHGYHLGEQGFWCKSSNYELDVRVPLIISHPSLPVKRIDQIVELVDIYPTIIDFCNIGEKTPLSGKSLINITGKSKTKWSNYAFNQFGRPYEAALSGKGMTHEGYSVRDKKFRLTLWFNYKNGEIEERELYYMNEGIEKKNISGQKKYQNIEEKLTQLVVDHKNQKYLKNEF